MLCTDSGAYFDTMERLTEMDLNKAYPIDVGAPGPITTGTSLVRLAMHTSYHNGQINYHRRLLAAFGGHG